MQEKGGGERNAQALTLRQVRMDSPDIPVLEAINRASFPEAQRTPIRDLLASDTGDLELLSIRLRGEPVGFFAVRIYESLRYIGYFAVAPEKRGGGIGSRALDMLQGHYSGAQLAAEIESCTEEGVRDPLRKRRRAFYIRNGFHTTGWYLFYDGTELEVLCTDGDFRKAQFEALTARIHTLYYDSIPSLYRK